MWCVCIYIYIYIYVYTHTYGNQIWSSNFQHPLDNRTSKRVPEKHLLLLYWLSQSLWLCGSQQAMENSERDGNTRPPYLSSVQFSHSVVSNSLRPHESQHARPPCPSPTPGVYSNSCPSSRWCHPASSSSVVPFYFCPQSLPASESFPMSQLFAWGGQSIGVSALASVLPRNSQDWFDLLAVQGTIKSLLQHQSSKASILHHSAFFTLPTDWEICMQVKKQQLEPEVEQQTGSKLGKEYIKAVYCHLVYLTFMQSTSYEMPGWMKHKLGSRLPGEISITSDMQMTPLLWQKVKKN